MERLAVCLIRLASLRKPDEQPSGMHGLDEGEIGAVELRKHLDAEIGDEAVAEIGDGDVGHIFGDGLDDGHHHDRGGDPVDHLLVLRHEHVVGGLLDDEGDGAGGRRGEQHGEARKHQQPDARAQMLPPDAHDDFARGVVVGLEVVGATPLASFVSLNS